MKPFILSVLLLHLFNFSFGQGLNIYDFNDKYYLKTDFTQIDTLNNWAFYIDTKYRGQPTDSVKPMGAIIFYRVIPLYDKVHFERRKELRHLYFAFDIYPLIDSVFCRNDSYLTRYYSSCSPPYTGGDIVYVGNFILLNRKVCHAFSIEWTTETDYARPIINEVFYKTNTNQLNTFEDFIRELPIKGELLE